MPSPEFLRILKRLDELAQLTGTAESRVRIRTKEKCPKCGRKFQETPLGLLCPKCITTPRRYYVYLSWKGRKIKVYSFRDGQPLSSWEMAKRARELISHEIESGTFDPSRWVKSDVRKFLVSTLIEEYLKAKEDLSPLGYNAKRSWLTNYILPHFGSMDVRDLRGYHLADLYERLKEIKGKKGKPLSTSSIHKIFVELRAFLNWCRKIEIIDRIPALPDIKVSEPPIRFLVPDQQARILSAIPEEHRPIFAFMFATGCRPGEARALMWDCVYLKDGFLVIRRAFSGDYLREIPKEGKQKSIPLVGVIREIVEEQAKNKRSVWVFPYRHPRRKDFYTAYPHKRLLVIFKEACHKAGIEGISLYQATRHSFAHRKLREGFSYEEVGAALGHSSPQTTRRYARLRAENVKSVFEGNRVLPFNRKKNQE